MRHLWRKAALVTFLLAPNCLLAQVKSQIFPAFVDGTASDGTSYKSTLIIIPTFNADRPNCTLTTRGLSVALESGEPRGTSFNFAIPAGGLVASRTNASQSLATGYATLTCDVEVYAELLVTFYAANGSKISEATAFSTEFESSLYKLIIDHRDAARLGLAIANNTDSDRTYEIRIVANNGIRNASITVSARRNRAVFADELMTVPAGTIGILTIQSRDRSDFSVIGLRFTGGAFTTVPANYANDRFN
jgi:hypothetical protein